MDISQGRGWTVKSDGMRGVITLFGDWIARRDGVEDGAAGRVLAAGAPALAFEAGGLGRWDSALISFLSTLRDGARQGNVSFDEAGLPASARRLLALVSPAALAPASTSGISFVSRIGNWGVALYAEAVEAAAMVGGSGLRGIAALRGRSPMRGRDLLDCMREAGAAALPIVTVVNLLVGGILAFVGAVQLRRFGADVYVASMVGVAVVREMAALMTAIIMAGRTGGAYAAHLATMQGNEEIDALRAFGIPVFDVLVLPRVLALTAMLPILYLHGCAMGVLGGFVVAVATLDVSAVSYVAEIRLAVSGNQFVLGFLKSLTFGALIALVGCRVGLAAGRGGAAIGQAATQAVVIGIVGVIALDAVFAICARALGV